METTLTALCALAGLTFSVSIALLVEELVLGRMFHLLFARTRNARTAAQTRKEDKYVAD